MKSFILVFVSFFPFIIVSCNDEQIYYASEEWTNGKEIYDSSRCGLPLKVDLKVGGREFKMMGGNEVEEGTMPWAVAIFMKNENGEEFYICTGTLVSKKHIITAAHCFGKPKSADEKLAASKCQKNCCKSGDEIGQNEFGEKISVYIGSVCLPDNAKPKPFGQCNSSRKQRKFGVKKGSYGHYFEAKCNFQDYAILELEEEVPAQIANHICLLHLHSGTMKENDDWMIGKPVKALGWGIDATRQSDGKEVPPIKHLHILNMADGIWPEDKCRDAVINGLLLPFYEDMLCTAEKFNLDMCKGDSGGGLIAKLNLTTTTTNDTNNADDEKRWFLIGVLSVGQDCHQMLQGNEEPAAQVYTSVFTYRTQISRWMDTEHLSQKLHKSSKQKKCEEMVHQDGDKEIWDWAEEEEEEECTCDDD